MTQEDSQKLFMNWAYCWRTKRRKETALQYLTIDPHSPPEFRANIVRNLDEFHTAFDDLRGRRPLARPRGARPDLVRPRRDTRWTGYPVTCDPPASSEGRRDDA